MQKGDEEYEWYMAQKVSIFLEGDTYKSANPEYADDFERRLVEQGIAYLRVDNAGSDGIHQIFFQPHKLGAQLSAVEHSLNIHREAVARLERAYAQLQAYVREGSKEEANAS